MSIGHFRSHKDTDAPVLLASLGSAIQFFDKILCDGYGSTPALGWSKIFSGTNKAVYRNQGTGMFLRVDHSIDALKVHLRAYESMQDVDTGLFPCPREDTEFYLLLSSSSSANAVPWKIIGDEKGFWFIASPYGTYYGENGHVRSFYNKFYYIGDYIPYDPTNIHYNFCMFQNEYSERNDPSACYWDATGNNKQEYQILRSPDNVKGAINIACDPGSNLCDYLGFHSCSTVTAGSPFQITSTPFFLEKNSGNFVGRIPGLKNSLSQKGYLESPLTTISDLAEKKPEMIFDYADYKEHFLLGGNGDYPFYFVLTSGKGFRNVF